MHASEGQAQQKSLQSTETAHQRSHARIDGESPRTTELWQPTQTASPSKKTRSRLHHNVLLLLNPAEYVILQMYARK